MKKLTLLTAVSLAALSMAGCSHSHHMDNQTQAMPAANSTITQNFVKNASVANEFEIESSQLALDKSHNERVRSFAQRMIDDHTATGEKLKAVVASNNIGVSPSNMLDSKHQHMLKKLQMLSGREFDKAYAKKQVMAHHEAVWLFSDYTQNGDNAALKDFAANTLPTLKEHEEHAESLQASLGGRTAHHNHMHHPKHAMSGNATNGNNAGNAANRDVKTNTDDNNKQ